MYMGFHLQTRINTQWFNQFFNYVLVVDSLKPTEVIVSFTSFSQWIDQPTPPTQAAPTTTASNPSHANVTKAGKESKDPKTPDKPPATAEPPSDVNSVVGGDSKCAHTYPSMYIYK